ncbi:unnamed protein product [Notodromas monacha]|uniref:Uncharacterized protein n=1 Tax=Notodromas monacha TaxID=399045 RepID=A0A7R9BI48_9CRUS|nr:unnamed protein product [Notodromas monacha]CAG0914336.1 unnamed protein product [Notodromas monacha]
MQPRLWSHCGEPRKFAERDPECPRARPAFVQRSVFLHDLDTDQETDRLLGQHRSDDGGFFRDEKVREFGGCRMPEQTLAES